MVARYSANLRNVSGLARPFRIHALLRLDRLAHLRVVRHAIDDLGEFVGVVRRAHDALEGVAADAVEQLRLLVVGAGHAHAAIRHW